MTLDTLFSIIMVFVWLTIALQGVAIVISVWALCTHPRFRRTQEDADNQR